MQTPSEPKPTNTSNTSPTTLILFGLAIGILVLAAVALGFFIGKKDPVSPTQESSSASTTTTSSPSLEGATYETGNAIEEPIQDDGEDLTDLQALEESSVEEDGAYDIYENSVPVQFESGTYCGYNSSGSHLYRLNLGANQILKVQAYAQDITVLNPDGSELPYYGQDYGEWHTISSGTHIVMIHPYDDTPKYFDIEFCAY